MLERRPERSPPAPLKKGGAGTIQSPFRSNRFSDSDGLLLGEKSLVATDFLTDLTDGLLVGE